MYIKPLIFRKMGSSKDSFAGLNILNVWHSRFEWMENKNRMPIKPNCNNYWANFSLAFNITCSRGNREKIQ